MAFYEDENLLEFVIRKIPIDEQTQAITSVAQVFPKIERLPQIAADLETYYTYRNWNAARMVERLWPMPLMCKFGSVLEPNVGEFEWTVQNNTIYKNLPSKLPSVEYVIPQLFVQEDETISLELFLLPKETQMLHTLPQWCLMYNQGMADAYSVIFSQKFDTSLENFNIRFQFKFDKKISDELYAFTLVLDIMGEESRDYTLPEFIMDGKIKWSFVYNNTTQTIQWTLPENETTIMFPPPVDKLNRIYEPGPMACSFAEYTNGISIRHCDPLDCEYLSYQLSIPPEQITRLLLGRD